MEEGYAGAGAGGGGRGGGIGGLGNTIITALYFRIPLRALFCRISSRFSKRLGLSLPAKVFSGFT